MGIVHCELSDAHHAIYRELNQTVATRLRLSAYVFDMRGCKYRDRTVSSFPINIQQIRDRLQVNLSIKNPIYIDIKSDRARAEFRQHISKKLISKADVPTYQETRETQSILSTLNEPSGLLIGEKNSSTGAPKILKANNSYQPRSTTKISKFSRIANIPSTLNGPSGLLIG